MRALIRDIPMSTMAYGQSNSPTFSLAVGRWDDIGRSQIDLALLEHAALLEHSALGPPWAEWRGVGERMRWRQSVEPVVFSLVRG